MVPVTAFRAQAGVVFTFAGLLLVASAEFARADEFRRAQASDSENCPGYPQTREGIVRCLRDGADAMRPLLKECRQTNSACVNLYDSGIRASECAADAIEHGAQVNPAVSACRQRYGI